MLKDPYIFDMLTFTDEYNERDVEIGLVKHVERFLVEMGAGFGFMGRQYQGHNGARPQCALWFKSPHRLSAV